MPLNLGTSALSKVALGGATLKSIYKGTSLVWVDFVAAPVVAGVVQTSLANVNTQVINLPSSIVAGDLLLVFVGIARGVTSVSWPSGWSPLVSNEAADGGIYVGYRIADGTEGSSISITVGKGQTSAAYALRITGAAAVAPEASAITANASTGTVDPASLTPSWGKKNNLWLALSSANNRTLTSWPSAYTGNQNGPAGNGYAAFATRELDAVSDDPGAFVWSSSGVSAVAIAVRPT